MIIFCWWFWTLSNGSFLVFFKNRLWTFHASFWQFKTFFFIFRYHARCSLRLSYLRRLKVEGIKFLFWEFHFFVEGFSTLWHCHVWIVRPSRYFWHLGPYHPHPPVILFSMKINIFLHCWSQIGDPLKRDELFECCPSDDFIFLYFRIFANFSTCNQSQVQPRGFQVHMNNNNSDKAASICHVWS